MGLKLTSYGWVALGSRRKGEPVGKAVWVVNRQLI
jgi:hypothetical protein